MLFAGIAAAAAIDLLSLLQAKVPSGKPPSGLAGQSGFEVPGVEADIQPLPADLRVPSSANRVEGLSRETLDALLSAQGEQAAQRKKRSISVLLELLQASQNGGVAKADFVAKASEGDSEASRIFERIDMNQDETVDVAELSAGLDTYRRAYEGGASGRACALAVVA